MTPQLKDPSLQKYLSKLKKQLQVLPRNEQEDVLKELESHVYEELQQGLSPEQILAKLGKPEAYAQSFVSQYTEQLAIAGKLPEHARFLFSQAILPGLIALAVFVGLMFANSLVIFAEMLVQNKLSWLRALQLLAYSLPAILVVTLPPCTLFIVPRYIYGLRGGRAVQILHSPRVWAVTLLTGLLVSGLAFGLQEVAVPAANRQTVEILKQMMNENRAQGTQELIFSDEHDVRSLSMGEAEALIKQKTAANVQAEILRKDRFDYHSKLALPLAAPACALYALLTASLMLSGLFQPTYTFLVIGCVLPLGLWYTLYAISANSVAGSLPPLLAAYLPNLALMGISLPFLLGLLLQRPRPD